MRPWHRRFFVNFAKFPTTPFYRTPPVAAFADLGNDGQIRLITFFSVV